MSKYTIAIDAMGGDDVPAVPVEAGVIAARDYGVGIILVGDESSVHEELQRHKSASLPIKVLHADDVINEGEHPALALRRKPRSSIAITVGLLKEGIAHASISLGSTGATMAASVFALGQGSHNHHNQGTNVLLDLIQNLFLLTAFLVFLS